MIATYLISNLQAAELQLLGVATSTSTRPVILKAYSGSDSLYKHFYHLRSIQRISIVGCCDLVIETAVEPNVMMRSV